MKAEPTRVMLAAAALLWAALQCIMFARCESLKEKYTVGDIPDAWFGIPGNKLYSYLDALGPEGRDAYMEINSLDLFFYIPSLV